MAFSQYVNFKLKRLGIVIWFGFFENGAKMETPSEIFLPLTASYYSIVIIEFPLNSWLRSKWALIFLCFSRHLFKISSDTKHLFNNFMNSKIDAIDLWIIEKWLKTLSKRGFRKLKPTLVLFWRPLLLHGFDCSLEITKKLTKSTPTYIDFELAFERIWSNQFEEC